jgi:threonine/homoserine/homoserine lactone efflux protein
MHEQFLSLVLFAAAVTFSPGPNVVLVTACAANFGFRPVVPQMLGITVTFGLMTMASGLGIASVVRTEPMVHLLLKYLGAAYLLYLAWRIGSAKSSAQATARLRPITYLEASVITALNPKAWVSVLGAVAAYTTVGGHFLIETTLIAGILAVSCLLSCIAWAGFGSAIGRLLSKPRVRTSFNWFMAGLLVVSLAPLFVHD